MISSSRRIDVFMHSGTSPVHPPRTRPDAKVRVVLWGVGGAHLGADYFTIEEIAEAIHGMNAVLKQARAAARKQMRA